MSGFKIKSSFLTRDRKAFLKLSQAEVDLWLGRVFERIAPTVNALTPVLFTADEPVNLVLILELTMDEVRVVAREMAGALLNPQRLAEILPEINAYCDDLMARGCPREAAFVQQGLICIQAGSPPEQNPLLVEICAQSIFQQVVEMNQIREPRFQRRSRTVKPAPKVH